MSYEAISECKSTPLDHFPAPLPVKKKNFKQTRIDLYIFIFTFPVRNIKSYKILDTLKKKKN